MIYPHSISSIALLQTNLHLLWDKSILHYCLGFSLFIFSKTTFLSSSSSDSYVGELGGEYVGEVGDSPDGPNTPVGEYVGLVGEYCGDVGEYVGLVGEYVGLVGEYCGEVAEYCGEVGEYCGDVGLYC